jgi:hypothetical protein
MRAVRRPAAGRIAASRCDAPLRDESDGDRKNLAYGCRSCNGKLAAAWKRLGSPVRTRQYNPASEENRVR